MSDNPPLYPVIEGAHAPIVFFDETLAITSFNAIVGVTLSAMAHIPKTDGTVETKNIVVAYLRTNLQGAMALRDSLDKAILMATPTQGNSN